MKADPFAVLGIDHSASLDDAEEAYRRLALRWHPDRLQLSTARVRAKGERRLREANAAIAAIRAASRGVAPPPDPITPAARPAEDPITASAAHEFNAQVRDTQPGGLHASWPGPHAAGIWSALRNAHGSETRAGDRPGSVRQVEWGAYECAIAGADVRRLLRAALAGGGRSWETERLDLLELGEPPRRRHLAGSDLGCLDRLIDDARRYVVTAEVL